MAVFMSNSVTVTINSVDLTDHITAVDLPVEAETQDSTAFGDDWRESIGGLKNGSVTIGFQQDFAASEVDATLWPLLGTSVEVIVKPTSSAISATNPAYTGNFIVSQLQPIAGSIGNLATMNVTWPLTGELVRDTTA